MNKTTKGALAAGAAATLLLGGAGTLAYWTAEQTVNGGAVTSGELKLSAGTCDTNWVYNGTSTTVTKFVPGDVVTKKCTFTVTATGDNLKATLTAPSTVALTGTNPASSSATVAATYTLGTTTPPAVLDGATITSNDNAKTLTATFRVTFPFGTNETGNPKVNTNDTQAWTATLNALTVKLTQVAA